MKSNIILNRIYRIFCYLVLISLLSCNTTTKNDKKDASGLSEKPFNVELWVSCPENTKIKLFYAEGNGTSFTEDNCISNSIAVHDQLHKVVFKLPQTLKAPQIRLDFETTSAVTLKRFTIKYGEQSIDAYGTEVFRYFMPDFSTCTINLDTGLITPLKKDGKLQTPSLYPHKKFFKYKMNELIK